MKLEAPQKLDSNPLIDRIDRAFSWKLPKGVRWSAIGGEIRWRFEANLRSFLSSATSRILQWRLSNIVEGVVASISLSMLFFWFSR
jgi:hypothetical protein